MMTITAAFFRTRPLLVPFVLGALLLTGCGSARYRSDYNGFNAAYADSSNHQMLLNLARLDQHDPSYFLQFGQISVQYQLSTSANAVVNDSVPQSTFHIPFVTGTGTIAAGATTTPQFTFIPVTDDKVAQELLLPLPPEDLYTLFQQGEPIDQLLRLMVERFEIQLPGSSSIVTYSNTPGRCDNFSYIVFLKICAIARELQLSGHLKLRTEEKYIPLMEGWTWSPSPPKKATGDASTATNEAPSDQPSADEVLAAHDKGLVYRLNKENKWSLYKQELVASFFLDGSCDDLFNKLKQDPVYGEGTALANVRTILTTQGFSVQGNVVESKSSGSRLILRSFMNVLAAAAQEQSDFSTALCEPTDRRHVPERELQPILKLKWNTSNTKLLPPLLSLDYRGQNYQVTDPVSGGVDESASWNRDIFRLLTELAGQASVDTSKFPLPTTVQVLQ